MTAIYTHSNHFTYMTAIFNKCDILNKTEIHDSHFKYTINIYSNTSYVYFFFLSTGIRIYNIVIKILLDNVNTLHINSLNTTTDIELLV